MLVRKIDMIMTVFKKIHLVLPFLLNQGPKASKNTSLKKIADPTEDSIPTPKTEPYKSPVKTSPFGIRPQKSAQTSNTRCGPFSNSSFTSDEPSEKARLPSAMKITIPNIIVEK